MHLLPSWLSQLELKLGLGGTSYADFIQSMHLPMQLRYALARVLLLFISRCLVSFLLHLIAIAFTDGFIWFIHQPD